MGPGENNHQRLFWREFLCLWVAAAFFGALSLSLTHFPPVELQRELLIPLHLQSTRALLAALIIQNSVQLGIAVGVGLIAAHRIGLGAPVLEAWLRNEPAGQYLRVPAIPILLTAFLIIVCIALPNASMFHPNRQQAAIRAAEIENSPVRAQLDEQIEKLGMTATKPYTSAFLAISYLADAIDGELNARLFELSVIVLLFVQIFGKAKTTPDPKFFWAAILIVALIRTTYFLWMRHENTILISEVFRGFGFLPIPYPYWLVAVRDSIPIFPPALAFGWLYSRYGIESAIVASFCGAMTGHWFMDLVWIHFLA